MRAAARLAALAVMAATAGQAQEAPAPAVAPALPVVVLDRDALYARSMFGQRVRADVEAALAQLGAENRRIEAMLEAEERALTERRPAEAAEVFRELATAFDRRVEGIREAQDAKARAIQDQQDRAQQVFLEEIGPVLSAFTREVGAQVILDRRMVIAATGEVDITEEALARIDAALADGAGLEPSAPTPRPGAETAPETGARTDPDR
ncbi:OmpH family outer membrane protein [Jannaschia sp. W003]|uniref:OmpH family outer membrane protein n=1 Tax=Jannaschia sp. W003 TaxID=2867012 RepID=UPI0021A40341|nr:OmpH family outer membrane protein [Jannaschia sp. W003]UWQ20465.1 OmpH family outer membrane protein [Jannaschia sp. W003]